MLAAKYNNMYAASIYRKLLKNNAPTESAIREDKKKNGTRCLNDIDPLLFKKARIVSKPLPKFWAMNLESLLRQ
jgi:hypothetical protein